ncbi:MAG: Rpn family recombination-promoting nuclease/putative transposase [Fibrobacter sp.]|nr:Rpn family recombination-promoting nuclease/putative transposase [Fibrobacter sp.]
MKKGLKTRNPKRHNRKHDPFFRYIFAVPENTRALLRLAQRKNPELRRMLASVDMQSLELIPGCFSNVKKWGYSDLAFKASFNDGPDVFVGILLEHKSYREADVLSQIYEYMFEVMVNKNETCFRWLHTKAIIIYNGLGYWDPLVEFREKYKGKLNSRRLPFECVFVNLADILDRACYAEPNVEAAVGVLVMKHAFDGDGLKKIGGILAKMLSKLEDSARATLAEKIELYLGEYLDENVVEDLSMRMSIGQALGIVTAGDRRRAAERAGLRRGRKEGRIEGAKQERRKNELENAARDKKIAKYLRSIGVSSEGIATALAFK